MGQVIIFIVLIVIKIRCNLIFIELYEVPVNYENWEIIIFILQNK